MKSILNLLRSTDKHEQLKANDMTSIKGGAQIEVMVEVTTVDANGNVCIVYCDRRRRKV